VRVAERLFVAPVLLFEGALGKVYAIRGVSATAQLAGCSPLCNRPISVRKNTRLNRN
jgi:hypothetical protein